MSRFVINMFTLAALSWVLSAFIIFAVWHILLDDRSVDIAVPDDALALVKHDPNPPMMAWRPRIPDAVGTSTFTTTAVTGPFMASCMMSGGAIVSTASSTVINTIPCELSGGH
jgi:hypothetical protein